MKKISKRILAQQPTTVNPVAIQRAIDVRRDQLKANLTRMLQQLNTILADNKKSNDQKIQEMGAVVGAFSKQIDTTFQQLSGPTITVAPGARTAAKKKDELSGGVGDDISYDKFNKEQLDVGAEVELEHTDNPEIAKEIAGDHLAEQLEKGKGKKEQDYYTELEKIDPHEEDADGESKCDTVVPIFWRRNLDYTG